MVWFFFVRDDLCFFFIFLGFVEEVILVFVCVVATGRLVGLDKYRLGDKWEQGIAPTNIGEMVFTGDMIP